MVVIVRSWSGNGRLLIRMVSQNVTRNWWGPWSELHENLIRNCVFIAWEGFRMLFNAHLREFPTCSIVERGRRHFSKPNLHLKLTPCCHSPLGDNNYGLQKYHKRIPCNIGAESWWSEALGAVVCRYSSYCMRRGSMGIEQPQPLISQIQKTNEVAIRPPTSYKM